MPYITSGRRQAMDAHASPTTPGELNYKITKNCLDFLGLSYGYTELNAIVGVLECAKAEFLRRMVTAYEDGKIAENGDVYAEAVSAQAPPPAPYCGWCKDDLTGATGTFHSTFGPVHIRCFHQILHAGGRRY